MEMQPIAETVVDRLNHVSHSISNQDMVATVQEALTSSLGPHFDKLYQRIRDDKRVSEATAAANQDAMLRLVSSTLTDNVEQTLNSIISANVRESVTPAAANAATSSIDRKLMELVPPHLNSVVPREIKSAVQSSISHALQNKDMMRSISDQVTRNLTGLIDHEFTTVLQNQITPSFRALATDSSAKVAKDLERRVAEQLRPFELQLQRESAVAEQLTGSIEQLLRTVEGLAASHSSLQTEIASLRSQITQQAATQAAGSANVVAAPRVERDEEVESIAELMEQGKKEEAIIKWLQSARQVDLFDKYFAHWNPDFLPQLNMIVLLSVSMAVSSPLKTNVAQRLAWISVVLETIDVQVCDELCQAGTNGLPADQLQNPDIAQYAPQLLEVLNNKLQDAYMDISSEASQSALLPQIRALIVRARTLKASIV